MMGAAESISDLRSLLSIVAEETGALKMNDADEDSVGWTPEGPLPMTFGHVRRAHAALAALEAALSPAEPVAWLPARRWEQMTAAEPWLTNIVYSQDQAKFFPCIPLYAAPPAPCVAVKALEALLSAVKSSVRETDEPHRVILKDGTAVTGEIADRWLNFMRLIREVCEQALSAQVQDVAGWQSIETAPKDGTQFLAFDKGSYFNCWRHDNGYGEQYWMDDADSEPNPWHWMPLPAAPAKQEG